MYIGGHCIACHKMGYVGGTVGPDLTRIGGIPITRMAVCPVPIPKKTRPGAMRLIDAIECAVTGATRTPGIATPVPKRILVVCCAARAKSLCLASSAAIWTALPWL